MTEVAGKGACYVNPFDIDDIKKGFLEIINNELYREDIIKEGVSNAEKYNPQTIADMYRNLYLKVFSQ
jgi:glycosyltransferase involved in cell wall biosynthesis